MATPKRSVVNVYQPQMALRTSDVESEEMPRCRGFEEWDSTRDELHSMAVVGPYCIATQVISSHMFFEHLVNPFKFTG